MDLRHRHLLFILSIVVCASLACQSQPYGTEQAQGRPVGMMVAWCRAVESGALHNKEAHKDHVIGFEARAAARTWFAGMPNSGWYLRQERLLREGEGAEPAGKS